MNTKNEANKQRRARYIAAGNCGICGKPRESPTRGGATNTQCKRCSDITRANERKNDRKRIADGKCPDCGKPHALPKPGRTKGTLCADCARKHRGYTATHRLKKKPDLQPLFGLPTTEPRNVGRAAKPLGPSAAIGFHLNQQTLDAINELKRRYKESHAGKSWRYHVAEILRDAVAGVLKKHGPIPLGRERICVRGWHQTLRFPLAQYQQITRIANEKFNGSRAMTVRAAICQAVNPPFVIKTGGVRVPGGKPRDPWDYD